MTLDIFREARTSHRALRGRRARAYRDLVERLRASSFGTRRDASLFDCLRKASWSESYAASSILAREVLLRENPAAQAPEEFSDATLAEYLASAGELYDAAGLHCISISDLRRAYKFCRKAAHCYARSAGLLGAAAGPRRSRTEEQQERTALIRQELARRAMRGRILRRCEFWKLFYRLDS